MIAGTGGPTRCLTGMRALLPVVLLVVTGTAVAGAAPGAADPDGTDDGTAGEAVYWVHGTLDGVAAKLGVRYRIAAADGWNHFELELPAHGMVTGAVVTADGGRHRLALDEAKHASEAFEGATSGPAGSHRRWAIEMADGFSGGLAVELAAPHAGQIAIDVEVEVPTCFRDDVRFAAVPAAWRASLDRSLVVSGRSAPCQPDGDAATADDAQAVTWIEFPARALAGRPFGAQRIATTAQRLDVAHGRFARLEVDLAHQLSQVPPDLYTVFVIDASRSTSQPELDAQAAIIASYVRDAPRSQVQVIAYARNARALLPGWTPASHANPRLQRELAALVTANGSNVDVGLVEASSWLARVPGTRRVVLFSDERLGDRVAGLEAKVLRSVLPRDTLVHVVALDGSTVDVSGTVVRDDEVGLGSLAVLTEGLAARGHSDGAGGADALRLVRPIELDHVAVHAAGWTEDVVTTDEPRCPSDGTGALAEGTSCSWWATGAAGAGGLRVDGLLWNRAVTRTLAPAGGEDRRLARMLLGFGANLGELAHEVAQAAHAVDEAWSLFGSWGGANGYADQERGGTYGGSTCGGSWDDIGIGVGHAGRLTIAQADLEAQLARATRDCHVDARVEIELELTLNEIVDVAVTAPSPALRDCVTEAVWAAPVLLASPQAHRKTTVVLGS